MEEFEIRAAERAARRERRKKESDAKTAEAIRSAVEMVAISIVCYIILFLSLL